MPLTNFIFIFVKNWRYVQGFFTIKLVSRLTILTLLLNNVSGQVLYVESVQNSCEHSTCGGSIRLNSDIWSTIMFGNISLEVDYCNLTTNDCWTKSVSNNSRTLENLCEGEYEIVLDIDEYCSIVVNAIIQEETSYNLYAYPQSLKPATNINNCNDGGLDINWHAGSGLFSGLWSGLNGYAKAISSKPKQSSEFDLQNVQAGQYVFDVESDNGCGFGEITIEIPCVSCKKDIVNSISVYPIPCENKANLTVLLNGNVPSPLSFFWNDGSTGQEKYNVVSGEYSVTVYDGAGCFEIAEVIVPEIINDVDIQLINPSYCDDGKIKVRVYGNDGPYNVYINGLLKFSGSSGIIDDLPHGQLTLNIVGSTCSFNKTYTVPKGNIELVVETNVDNDQCNRSVSVVVPDIIGHGDISVSLADWTGQTNYQESLQNDLTNTLTFDPPPGRYKLRGYYKGCRILDTYINIDPFDCESCDFSIDWQYTYDDHNDCNTTATMTLKYAQGVRIIGMWNENGEQIPISYWLSGFNGARVFDLETGIYHFEFSKGDCQLFRTLTIPEPSSCSISSCGGFGFFPGVDCVPLEEATITLSLFSGSGHVTNIEAYSDSGNPVGTTISSHNFFSLVDIDFISEEEDFILTLEITWSDGSVCKLRKRIVSNPLNVTLDVSVDCIDFVQDGFINASISGGQEPYNISWTNPDFLNGDGLLKVLDRNKFGYPQIIEVMVEDGLGCTVESTMQYECIGRLDDQ